MGKTYRKEKPQYKKNREETAPAHKKVDHDHERTHARRQLRDVYHHWDDEEQED